MTVGYHIRFERVASKLTVLTYATTGILLKTLISPGALDVITHIVLVRSQILVSR